MKRLLLLLVLMSWALPLDAQENPTAIRAGRLLDVRTGELRSNVTILVRDGKVVAVGENLRLPSGAQIIDLSQATVLPGLIDSHTHLTGDNRYFGYRGLGISQMRQALFGVVGARKVLEAGFTTVRDVGAGGFADIALRDAVNDGDLPGPRILASGPSLGITGGHCDDNLLPVEYDHRARGVADGPWAVRAKVRENIKYGADVIKFCATGGVLSKGDEPGATQYTFEEMHAIVEEAHKLGRKVAAHAHGTEGINLALRAGVDTIEHGSLIDGEGIRLMKERGAYLVPTIYTGEYIVTEGEKVGIPDYGLRKMRGLMEARERAFRAAFAAGVKVAFGTDSAVFPHGQGGREFALMVKLGMTPLQAIQSATLVAAEALGLQNEIGAIEVGKQADLIAVSGNPLENVQALEDVTFVMKGGKVYKNSPL
ncbi:MAG TPA: amidohydrolase family protein [Candidatus Xenobia bacterium]|nr:amidohydrolase family protein [Candidatus Xenobia bacterium]